MTNSLQPTRLFPHLPTVEFAPQSIRCRCSGEAFVSKTQSRIVATMEIGAFKAHETILKCSSCGSKLRSEELRRLVPYRGKYGFDVIEYIGMSLFVHSRGEQEVQQQLKERNIDISRSEIGYLGKKFIAYLALLHQDSSPLLRKQMAKRGGYSLHLDATCEGGSPHLFSALDEVGKLVLGNIKLPSEKSEYIIPFLSDLKRAFGNPVAIVSDMGFGIESAVKEVFPEVKKFICHFHFLRDVGKDLFGSEYHMLRKALRSYGTTTSLRKLAKTTKEKIAKDPELNASFNLYIENNQHGIPSEKLPSAIIVYTLCLWALGAKQEATGYGFPFDRIHLDTFLRLIVVKDVLKRLKRRGSTDKHTAQLDKIISSVIHDSTLKVALPKLQEKIEIFDQLRSALRIAAPENTHSLNDDGETVDVKTIESNVTKWKQQVELTQRATSQIAFKRLLKQLDKYWDKLFADPIIVETKQGEVRIQPQRTNNILERLFRDLKRGYRKRTGDHRLTRTLKAMLADVPLVKNLSNPNYIKTLLEGKNSLAARFADIDSKLVLRYLAQHNETHQPVPPDLAKILRFPELPLKIVQKYKSLAGS